jgi:hypothetical protein
VYYLPNAVSGIARIQAQALSIYDERVMGESEIITIYVTP